MASLKCEAKDLVEVAREGIGWIAVWKNKNRRGWNLMSFWPDYDEARNTFSFSPFELEQLRNITRTDLTAVLVNSFYHNLGDPEKMNPARLADALRWHYDECTEPLIAILANCLTPAIVPACKK